MGIIDVFAKRVWIMGFYFSEKLSGSVGEVPGQPQSGVLKVSYLMVNQNRDDLNDPANSQWSSNLNQEEFGQVNRKRLGPIRWTVRQTGSIFPTQLTMSFLHPFHR